MRKAIIVLLIVLTIFTAGCDTELVHPSHEDHDHDGDGIQDHSPEGHEEYAHDENQTEENYS